MRDKPGTLAALRFCLHAFPEPLSNVSSSHTTSVISSAGENCTDVAKRKLPIRANVESEVASQRR